MFYEEKMSLALKEVDCHFVLHSLQLIPCLEWWPIILEVKKKNWPNVDWDDHWSILDQQICELHILQLRLFEMGWIYVFTSTDLGPNGGLWFLYLYIFPWVFRSVSSWKESKHEADNNPPLPWDYTLSLQFMELPLQTLTLSLVSDHPGLRSCLIFPVLVVSLNLAHCFPGLQNLG